VLGYHLKNPPVFDVQDTPWGKKPVVVMLLEVEGAGQEDWILDVALELARDGQTHPPLRREQPTGTLSDAAIEFEPLH
jgi:hypothetical protein